MKRLYTVLLAIVFLHLGVQPAQAVSDPPLFSCQQPVGSLIAAYEQGTHGIPGDMSTHTGSDYVYRVDDAHVLQCFCPEQGQIGIQSNWWKVPELSLEEIEYYVKRGWVFVPNGKLWGLDDAPYLVKNDSYECHGVGGSGSSSGSSSSNGASSSNTSSGSSSNDGGIGGAVGSILGISSLAATGSAQSIAFYILVGISSAAIAYRLRKN